MVSVPGASGTRTFSGEKTGGSSPEPELLFWPQPAAGKTISRQNRNKQSRRAEMRLDIAPLLFIS